jgi:uncharacterized membrane protein
MRFETTVDIDAAPGKIWSILTDLERWPHMTPSITGVERLDGGALAIGSQSRVHQPKLRPAVWTVTELDPGRVFVWESRAPGVVTIAGHYLTPADDGATVRFTLDQQGPAAPLIGLLYGRLTRRYVTQEAQGLKRLAES